MKPQFAVIYALLATLLVGSVTYWFESRSERGRQRVVTVSIGNQVIARSTGGVMRVMTWNTNGLDIQPQWRTNVW